MEVISIMEAITLVVTLLMFISGLPPCLEMYRTKSTKNVPYHIFLMAAVGCFGMFHYGLMVGNNILIFLNVVGAALQSLYVYLYLSVVLSKSKPLFYLLIAFLYEAVLYTYVFGHLVGHSERAEMIGYCSSLLTTVMLLLPIVEVYDNVCNKNADGMPIIMLVGGLACGTCWLVYGLMLNDPNIYAPNIPGIVITLLKFLMIFLYGGRIKSD
jgi:solute carrier family 50 protein (sugar transporter)